MSKITEFAVLTEKEELAEGIFSMWISTKAAETAVPGQFVSLYCRDQSRLLPRPISICEIDKNQGALHLVYRVVGKGTDEFSHYQVGEQIKLVGPLGNGFSLEGERPVVIGGGIGVPPMLQLSKELHNKLNVEPTIILGYRNRDLFLKESFDYHGNVHIATDDGSVGVHGTVVDLMEKQNITGDVIYACGPKPMLAAVKAYAEKNDIKCYVSMEERMACGIGACLGCVCKTKNEDEHSKVHNARICKDGPVFLAEEVEL